MSSIFGGGGAARSAARAQQAGVEAGVAEQRRQFDIAQQQAAPFRQAGLSALQQQLALLGLPGLQPQQFAQPSAAVAGAGQPQLTQGFRTLFRGINDPRFAGFGAEGLARIQAQQQGQQAQTGEFAFPEAVSREQALTAFAETPGQQFLRERQERSLLRSAGAIGGLGGGNIRTALQEQAFGRSATQLGQFQNRLAALTGGAQTATAGLAQLGGQTAGQISGLLQAGGQAQASGILGAQQARAGLGQQFLGAGLGAAAGAGLFGTTAATAFGGGAGAGALLGLIGSDKNIKHDINELDLEACFEAVLSMPLKSWRYLEEIGLGQDIHFGPMSQEAPEMIKVSGKEMLDLHSELMMIAGAIQYMKKEEMLNG